MQTQPLPVRFLAELNHNYPQVWKWADEWRASRGKDLPEWPQEVFLPMAAWYALCCMGYKVPQLTLAQAEAMGRLAAAAAWRPTQDIVKFEPELVAELMATPLTGDIPADVLWRLPAWCVYIEQAIMFDGKLWAGFFAYLEEDANDHYKELRLHFLREGDDFSMPIPIGKWSLTEALARLDAEARKNSGRYGGLWRSVDQLAGVEPAVNLVLYLCAYGFSDRRRSPEQVVSYPKGKKVKGGWRLFPPDRPVVHTAGKKLAEALREAKAMQEREYPEPKEQREAGTHASPRPHIRRGHWHGYWMGPRKEAWFDVRWLPPIPVAMKEQN